MAGDDWLVARPFVSDVCFLYPDDVRVFRGAGRTDNPKMYVADENLGPGLSERPHGLIGPANSPNGDVGK